MMALKLAAVFFLTTAFEIGFIDAFHPDYTMDATCSLYKFHTEEANWTAARDTCRSEGGLLFHPQSDAELEMVLRLLGVEEVSEKFGSINWIHTGLSDFGELTKYKTVDGRPVDQVLNKWYPGQPNPYSDDTRCVTLNIKSHELFVSMCSFDRRYICKILSTESKLAANSSNSQTTILERLAEAAAKQAAALERLTANQAAVLQTLTDTMKSQIANQTAALERIAVTGAKEAAAIERIAVAETHEAAAIELMSLAEMNQTTIMERQALALEKLVSLQEESDQIDVRTEQ